MLKTVLIAVALLGLADAPALAQQPLSDAAKFSNMRLRAQRDPAAAAAMRAKSAPPDDPMPANAAELDARLAARDYAGVNAMVTPLLYEKAELTLNWERAKVYQGGGIYEAILFAGDLWRLGEAVGPEGDGYKVAALDYALYAYALMVVDAATCAEPDDGPARRRAQHRVTFGPVWDYAASLSQERRDRAVMSASLMETLTAPLRKADAPLCQGPPPATADEIDRAIDALAAAGQQLEQWDTPLGKVQIVPAAPPRYARPAVARRGQDAVRRRLPQLLAESLGKPGAPH